MYLCEHCNARFLAPNEYYQTHSFNFPPYELFRECPKCSSTYISEINMRNEEDDEQEFKEEGNTDTVCKA